MAWGRTVRAHSAVPTDGESTVTRVRPRRLMIAATLLATLAQGACGTLVGVRAVPSARPGATTYHELQVDGRRRHFLLHLPPDAVRRRVPLVLAFHGHGGNGATLRAVSRLDAVADALGFAVVYPDGTGTLNWIGLSWNAGTCCGQAQERGVDDLTFVDSVVATLARSAPVDSARVFAVGFSAGGMLALRLACSRASMFTAVADLAGAMPDVPCRPSHPVSVLLVQGAADEELRFDLRTLPRPHGHLFAHSLEQAQRFWAGVDGCATGELAGDSTTSRVSAHAVGCPAGVAVELISIAHHPHAWPGGLTIWPFAPQPSLEVDASRLVLEFFEDAGPRLRLPSDGQRERPARVQSSEPEFGPGPNPSS